jgi:hypothetical protein
VSTSTGRSTTTLALDRLGVPAVASRGIGRPAGVGWALVLRSTRPAAYERIGLGGQGP